MISIKKGINLPISGVITDTTINEVSSTSLYGIIGEDLVSLKPTMLVAEGDKVSLGQKLFEDKKNAGVFVCSPVSGTVKSIVRGERRKFISLIIEKDDSDAKIEFQPVDLAKTSREDLISALTNSGIWTAIRVRPFDKIANPTTTPHSIFVNTMDTNPLSFDPTILLEGRDEDYFAGLSALELLTAGDIHVAKRAAATIPKSTSSRVKEHEFDGIHPAGLVGTHIHFIDPVGAQKFVWHINLQDLLMLGKFVRTGELDTSKVVAIAGTSVKNPQLVRTIRGADISVLTAGNLTDGDNRIISGSVFAGRKIDENTQFLGVYDQQISVLPEGRDTEFMGYMKFGSDKFSVTRAYLGRFLKKPNFRFTTNLNGSHRPVVPFGIYEDVMPLDILPTLLVKALIMLDTDTAIDLGALELSEEDIALLTYVDSGKHDFGAILRENLTLIEQEG